MCRAHQVYKTYQACVVAPAGDQGAGHPVDGGGQAPDGLPGERQRVHQAAVPLAALRVQHGDGVQLHLAEGVAAEDDDPGVIQLWGGGGGGEKNCTVWKKYSSAAIWHVLVAKKPSFFYSSRLSKHVLL